MKWVKIFTFYLIFATSFSFTCKSQTTLSAGDVGITSFNSDGDDEFSFVLLKDITSGTKIYFTENGWDDDANGGGVAPTWGDTSEGTLTWTSSSAMSCGTEIQVIKPHVNATLEVSAGSISKSGIWAVKSSGEAIIIYQGTAKPTDGTEVTAFLWAFNSGSSGFVSDATATATTGIPTGLVSGTDAIYVGSLDNFRYNCTTLGALASLKTAFATPGNFTGTTSTVNYKASGCSFYCTSVNSWTGSTDTDWNTTGNWSAGIPTSSSTVSIPNVTNKPVISSATTAVANNMTVNDILTINGGGNLTISSNATNNGSFILNSDATKSASLIVTTTATGNVTYNRYLTSTSSTKWHLIAAPVGAQTINTFVTNSANHIATGAISGGGLNYSLTPYDNSATKGSASAWNHWTDNGSGAGNISAATSTFVAGKGYEILTTADGTVAFTGTVPVANVSIAITKPASNNAWNLIGNPFPSSIPANSNADATNNFITVNTAAMDASYQALYLWNPGTSSYNLINQASALTYIAPCQGFFVKSVAGGGTVNFTTAMRSHQSTVAFQKVGTTATPSITLIADDNAGKISTTAIKYMGGMTLGLDPGYDGGLFDASGGNFSLYSKLVNDNGVDFMLQVLPDNAYDTTVIPIGLDADAGTQITFRADYANLPVGKKVYLEDRMLNSFNEINNTDKFYNVTLSTQSQGVGRFYLRTLDNLSTLAIQDFNTLGISLIAHPKENSIRIIGNIKSITRLAIYDMLGRLIYTTVVRENNNNEVRICDMSKGVYIVKIQTEKGNYNTKIAWY